MARSIDTIYNEMVAASNQYSSLSELNNSTASIQRLMMRVVATGIYSFEVLLDLFRNEIRDLAKDTPAGTERWFVYRAELFQYDETTPQVLQVTDRRISYETEDESLRVITQAACVTRLDPNTGTNRIFLKLAKGETGALEPLSASELDAATSYFNRIKMAGQDLQVNSDPADRFYINADIYIDAQFVQSSVESDIEEALNAYLNNLEFNGIVYYQKIVDAIQLVDGVQDIVVRSMAARDVNTDFASRDTFNKEYEPSSGYFILEDDSNNTLNNSLNYYVV